MNKLMTVYGDGLHDDTESLQAWANEEAELIFPDGRAFDGTLADNKGTFLLSETIKLP